MTKYAGCCFNSLAQGKTNTIVGRGAAKSILKRVDYELRPAHSTCGEWLENISQNNPENSSQQVCNKVQQEEKKRTDHRRPKSRKTCLTLRGTDTYLVFTRSFRDGELQFM